MTIPLLTLLSLFSGSLGLALLMNSQWWFWRSEKIEQAHEEEDQLTQYQSPAKTAVSSAATHLSGWEFKIVRSQRNIFHHPPTLKKLCQEESQGGWVLLEKLDDRRLRFKRPMALRDKTPSTTGYDPYRSFYGQRWSLAPLFSGVIVIVMTGLPAYLAYRLVTLQLQQPAWPSQTETPNLAPPSSSQFSAPPSSTP